MAEPEFRIRADTFVRVDTDGVQRLARITTTVPDPFDPEKVTETTILLDQPAVALLIGQLERIQW